MLTVLRPLSSSGRCSGRLAHTRRKLEDTIATASGISVHTIACSTETLMESPIGGTATVTAVDHTPWPELKRGSKKACRGNITDQDKHPTHENVRKTLMEDACIRGEHSETASSSGVCEVPTTTLTSTHPRNHYCCKIQLHQRGK